MLLKNIEKNDAFGLIIGISGFFLGSVFVVLAYLNSPSYNPVEHTISKLGIQTQLGGFYFTIGVLTLAISMAVYFWFYVQKKVIQLSYAKVQPKLSLYSVYLGIIGSIFLSGVGLLPDRDLTVIPHFLTAAAMFFSYGSSIFLISYLIFKGQEKESSNLKLVAYLGFAVCAMAIIHGILSTLKFYGPVWQKIAVFGYIIWFIVFTISTKDL